MFDFFSSGRMKKIKSEYFFVFQGILSPNLDYIINKPMEGVEKLAELANNVVKNWLEGINCLHGIVITDFSILDFPNFTRSVFSLNW